MKSIIVLIIAMILIALFASIETWEFKFPSFSWFKKRPKKNFAGGPKPTKPVIPIDVSPDPRPQYEYVDVVNG
ncbi:hypothetical protein RDWZM_004869 [Blomia tropicalis]|uniref:Uncharacterized protein n=1 Tax=Blomia tropicalis TaxID=40697 RepID=A0A9Q0M6Y1_BLOTA|nr:hypothetical protein RDWZM_004869 [Blomia tropicalis]